MAVQNLILGSFTRGNQKLAGAMESENFTHFWRKNAKFQTKHEIPLTSTGKDSLKFHMHVR